MGARGWHRRTVALTVFLVVVGMLVLGATSRGTDGHGRLRSGSTQRAAAAGGEEWTVLARSPLEIQFGASLVWDGRELLEIGGSTHRSSSPIRPPTPCSRHNSSHQGVARTG